MKLEGQQTLTKHVQADFFGLLPSLVLGHACVITLVDLLHIFDQQLGTILVQAVLVARLKDDVVAVGEVEDKKNEKEKK